MNKITVQLVAFYARHGVEGVKNDPDFVALCDAHEGDRGFDATQRHVQNVEFALERNVDGQPYGAEQVKFALKTLNTFGDENDREILSELVHARHSPSWSTDQRTYFDQAAEKLGWQDYFLSFTSYNPTVGEINVVNSAHRYLIRDQTPEAWEDRQARSRANLLANMLDYVLRNRQLRGFYYKRHEGDSSQVMTKLTENAQQSLTFVQLLQSAMFVKQPPPNFCHVEYELSVADESKTLVFVRAEPLGEFIKRENVDNSLHGWYDDVAGRDPFELATTRRRAATTIEGNLDGLRDRVVAKVQAARERLFTEVPR
jgi:hypothetical protein